MKTLKLIRAPSESTDSTSLTDYDNEVDLSCYDSPGQGQGRVILFPTELKVVFIREMPESDPFRALSPPPSPAYSVFHSDDWNFKFENKQIPPSPSSEITVDVSTSAVLPTCQQLSQSDFCDSLHEKLARETEGIKSQVMEVERKLSANNNNIADMRHGVEELFHEFESWEMRHGSHHQNVMALSKDLMNLEVGDPDLSCFDDKSAGKANFRGSEIIGTSTEPDAQTFLLDRTLTHQFKRLSSMTDLVVKEKPVEGKFHIDWKSVNMNENTGEEVQNLDK